MFRTQFAEQVDQARGLVKRVSPRTRAGGHVVFTADAVANEQRGNVRLLQMKIALYCRVSTSDQNCEMQLRELREYAAERKWTVHAEYVDTG
jgi:predicted site-specific integrase-resolvase